MQADYRIELWGGLKVRRGTSKGVTRFRTQKTAALLAYLAYHRGQQQTREKIADAIWPDADLTDARASLSTALSSLRRQFEPPGTSPGAFIVADRLTVELAPTVAVDTLEFESLLDVARRCSDPREATALREQAVALCSGEFMPGFYEDWVVAAQTHLSARLAAALCQIARCRLAQNDTVSAREIVRRALAIDPNAAVLTPELESLVDEIEGEALPATAVPAPGARGPHHQNAPAPQEVQKQATSVRTPQTGNAAPVAPPFTLHRSPFFGRESELREISALLGAGMVRLITLAGPGGVGKTRLALTAAHNAQRSAPELRVCWAPFTDVTGDSQLISVLRRAVGLPHATTEGSAQDVDDLVHAIREVGGPILLLADSAEHVSEALSELLSTLTERAENVYCLVTSRKRLLCYGEYDISIGPLPVPPPAGDDATEPGNPEDLVRRYPALALFADRAIATLADFAITPTNVEAVTALVRRLEGIPLAIELAAARVQSFTPAQIAEHLDRRFELLQHRRKRSIAERQSGYSRHLSLKETIAWSFDLLPPDQRVMLGRLSVFRGGWTLEAAARVVATDPSAPHDLLSLSEAMDCLCDASLVNIATATHGSPDQRRFAMLDMIREFAEEDIAPATVETSRLAHARYYLALAETAQQQYYTDEAAAWIERLSVESENFRSILDWSLHENSTNVEEIGVPLCVALARYWLVRGHWSEGVKRTLSGLMHPQLHKLDPILEANARNTCAILAMTLGKREVAEPNYLRSLEIRRSTGDRRGVAAVLNNLAIMAAGQSHHADALVWITESLAIAEELEDRKQMGVLLLTMGSLANEMGDIVNAERYLNESIAINIREGNPRPAAVGMSNLSELYLKTGLLPRAEQLCIESLSRLLPTRDASGCTNALLCLGVIAFESGQTRRGQRLAETALRARAAMGMSVPPYLAERASFHMGSAPGQEYSLTPASAADAALKAALRLAAIALETPILSQDALTFPDQFQLRLVG